MCRSQRLAQGEESLMRFWIRNWGPAVLVMGVIFAASSMPANQLPEFENWDALAKKAGHMLGYALLAAAYLHALHRGQSLRIPRLIASVCLAIIYAVSDEWHQTFVPGRTGLVTDVGIDAAGSIIGLASWLVMRRLQPVAPGPTNP